MADDTLTQARKRKSNKYEAIEKNIKDWLNMYKEEIKQKYHVDKTEVKIHSIIISTLGILQTQTYSDFIRLIRIKDSGKRQLAKNWVKRMILQACRGSFEFFNNVNENILKM
jgi:hypothetical protein